MVEGERQRRSTVTERGGIILYIVCCCRDLVALPEPRASVAVGFLRRSRCDARQGPSPTSMDGCAGSPAMPASGGRGIPTPGAAREKTEFGTLSFFRPAARLAKMSTQHSEPAPSPARPIHMYVMTMRPWPPARERPAALPAPPTATPATYASSVVSGASSAESSDGSRVVWWKVPLE